MAFADSGQPSGHREMLDSIQAALAPEQWQYVENIMKVTGEMKADTDRAKKAAQNLRVTNKALRAERSGTVTTALYNMLLARLGVASDLREETRLQLSACFKALGLRDDTNPSAPEHRRKAAGGDNSSGSDGDAVTAPSPSLSPRPVHGSPSPSPSPSASSVEDGALASLAGSMTDSALTAPSAAYGGQSRVHLSAGAFHGEQARELDDVMSQYTASEMSGADADSSAFSALGLHGDVRIGPQALFEE